MYNVLVYDRTLGRRVFAYDTDGVEMRFPTQDAAAAAIWGKVGHGKNWPCLYVIERATGPRQTYVVVTEEEHVHMPSARRFKRLSEKVQDGVQQGRFKRLARRA